MSAVTIVIAFFSRRIIFRNRRHLSGELIVRPAASRGSCRPGQSGSCDVPSSTERPFTRRRMARATAFGETSVGEVARYRRAAGPNGRACDGIELVIAALLSVETYRRREPTSRSPVL